MCTLRQASYLTLTVVSGVLEAVTVFLFFFNMLMTLLTKVEQPKKNRDSIFKKEYSIF